MKITEKQKKFILNNIEILEKWQLEEIIEKIGIDDLDREYASELIKDIIEKGLPLERFSPEERFEIDYDNIHLFSVKSEDILKSEENKRLYSSLLCAIETLQKYKININQSITSKNKELYVTYKYPSSQYGYFENLQHSWEDIKFIIERKPWWSQREIDELEEQLQEKITGRNDVLFSDDV